MCGTETLLKKSRRGIVLAVFVFSFILHILSESLGKTNIKKWSDFNYGKDFGRKDREHPKLLKSILVKPSKELTRELYRYLL